MHLSALHRPFPGKPQRAEPTRGLNLSVRLNIARGPCAPCACVISIGDVSVAALPLPKPLIQMTYGKGKRKGKIKLETHR